MIVSVPWVSITSFVDSSPLYHSIKIYNYNHPLQFVGASMGTSNLKIPSKSSSSDSVNSPPARACCVVVEYLPGGKVKKFLIRNRRKKLAFKIVIQLALDLSRG